MNDPVPPPTDVAPRGGITLRTVVVAALVALVAGGAVVLIGVVRSDAPTDPTTGLAGRSNDVVGTRAPVRYTTFAGDAASTEELVGVPLVVNFFAEWCPPCVAEMPDFETVHQELDGEVVFLGLSTLESVDAATGLIERTGITYEVGRDADGQAFSDLNALFMPTTVFIDSEGTIVGVHSGALTADQLRERIRALL